MASHSHPDVEFEVSSPLMKPSTFRTIEEAEAYAMQVAMTNGESTLDVLIWSEDGAAAWGGDDAVEQYNEDPEASVFERFEITVNAVGRVP